MPNRDSDALMVDSDAHSGFRRPNGGFRRLLADSDALMVDSDAYSQIPMPTRRFRRLTGGFWRPTGLFRFRRLLVDSDAYSWIPTPYWQIQMPYWRVPTPCWRVPTPYWRIPTPYWQTPELLRQIPTCLLDYNCNTAQLYQYLSHFIRITAQELDFILITNIEQATDAQKGNNKVDHVKLPGTSGRPRSLIKNKSNPNRLLKPSGCTCTSQ